MTPAELKRLPASDLPAVAKKVRAPSALAWAGRIRISAASSAAILRSFILYGSPAIAVGTILTFALCPVNAAKGKLTPLTIHFHSVFRMGCDGFNFAKPTGSG